MGFLATVEQTSILGLYLNGGTKSNVDTLYMGLCTSVAADGTITGEPSATNNYGRVTINTGGTTVFGAASSGQISNTAPISFPQSSGAWSEGATLSYWFLSANGSVGQGTAIMYGLIDNGANPDGVAVSAANTTVSFGIGNINLDASGW